MASAGQAAAKVGSALNVKVQQQGKDRPARNSLSSLQKPTIVRATGDGGGGSKLMPE
uniref:Uncharacterized protein n=1 Tax=Lilium longiflorum TaxID=4690 RepID=B2BAA6_LILLO|nr:unknown [Lilium longiflorum]